MRVFFLFLALYFVSAFPLCATADDFDSQAQITAMAARLDVKEVFISGDCDLHAWFEAQDSTYVEALKDLLHAHRKGALYCDELLNMAKANQFTLDELIQALPYAASHPFSHIILPCMREGHHGYVGACARLLGGFHRDNDQEGAVIGEFLGEQTFPDRGAFLFLEYMKTHFHGRLEVVASQDFRTFQLQLLMPVGTQISDQNFSLLRAFMARTCEFQANSCITQPDYERTRWVIDQFLKWPRESMARLLTEKISDEELATVLAEGGWISLERRALKKWLSGYANFIGAFDLARTVPPEDITRLFSFSQHSRLCAVATKHFRGGACFPYLKDMCRVICLFDGVPREEVSNMNKVLFALSEAEIDQLLRLGLKPSMRLVADSVKDWLPLHAPDEELFALLEKIVEDETANFLDKRNMSWNLAKCTSKEQLTCLERIIALPLTPAVRCLFVSQVHNKHSRGAVGWLDLLVFVAQKYGVHQCVKDLTCMIWSLQKLKDPWGNFAYAERRMQEQAASARLCQDHGDG